MKHKFDRNIRIMSDLVAYCHRMGGVDYQIDLKLEKNVSVFFVKSKVSKMTTEELERLRDTLSTPRQHEIEESYWGLSGESETDEELRLVGMMVDAAMVDYFDGNLTIVLRRIEE